MVTGDPAGGLPVPVPVPGPPGEAAVRDALGDWRQDALLIGLLPVLCWPALIGALVTRPAPLQAVLLGMLCLPVLVALRELYVARCVRRALREPELRWTAYDVRVLRGHGLPPLVVLSGGSGGRGRRGPWVLTLGPLGRRVLPPRAWPGTDPALPPAESASAAAAASSASEAGDPPPERFVWLAGDPGPGAVVWAPRARELGRARRLWRRGVLSR